MVEIREDTFRSTHITDGEERHTGRRHPGRICAEKGILEKYVPEEGILEKGILEEGVPEEGILEKDMPKMAHWKNAYIKEAERYGRGKRDCVLLQSGGERKDKGALPGRI